MAKSTKLEWKKRSVRSDTETAERRVWSTRCGQYLVIESKSLYKLGTSYYAMFGWKEIISRHKKKGPAIAACNQHARTHDNLPKPAGEPKAKLKRQKPVPRNKRVEYGKEEES